MGSAVKLAGRAAARLENTDESVSWTCAFCGKLRFWDGARPCRFAHLDDCPTCGDRVADKPADREAILLMIARHLL